MNEKASVLIADDNLSLCKTMSFTLKRKGYAVTTAKGGAEAMQKGAGHDIVSAGNGSVGVVTISMLRK